MITDTRDRIIEFIKANRQARVDDLVKFLGLSHVAIHKKLKQLISDGLLQKTGKPPLVFYTLTPKTEFPQQGGNTGGMIALKEKLGFIPKFLDVITPQQANEEPMRILEVRDE